MSSIRGKIEHLARASASVFVLAKNKTESTLARKGQWKSTAYDWEPTRHQGDTQIWAHLRHRQRRVRGSLELRRNGQSPETTGFELQLTQRWRRNCLSQEIWCLIKEERAPKGNPYNKQNTRKGKGKAWQKRALARWTDLGRGNETMERV